MPADLWETLAREAAEESPLWGASLRPAAEREREPVFSPLCEERYALGLETIYEGYLLHYGRPRLFAPPDGDTALLLGDYLYAHGLVRIAAAGSVEAVDDLAQLVSLCAQLRADGVDGDAVAWAATAACLSLADPVGPVGVAAGGLDAARDALRLERDAAPLEALARARAGDGPVVRSMRTHAARAPIESRA